MSSIVSGAITVEDGVRNTSQDQYAPTRKVSVTYNFVVPENGDEDAIARHTADAVNEQVNALLGRTEAVKPAVQKKKAPTDKDKKAEAAGLPTKDIVSKEPETIETTELVEDGIDDLLGDAAPAPITDVELAKAAQAKNAAMKTKDPNFSVKIRALVVEYAGPPPKKITDVPVAKRQEFLEKLRDLS